MLGNKALKRIPRKMLQYIMKNAILVPHGVDPFLCPKRRETLGHQ